MVSERVSSNCKGSHKLWGENSIHFSHELGNNRLGSLIGQTAVVTRGENCLTNQDRSSTLRDDVYICACREVYHNTYIVILIIWTADK